MITIYSLISKYNGDNKPTIGECKYALVNMMRGEPRRRQGKYYNLKSLWIKDIPSDHKQLWKLLRSLELIEI